MPDVTVDRPKLTFELGQTLATPGAMRVLESSGQTADVFLDRHARGDWGDVCPEDGELNDRALQDGSRLLSAYHTSQGVKVWVITEAIDESGHRAATTLLLPDEY